MKFKSVMVALVLGILIYGVRFWKAPVGDSAVSPANAPDLSGLNLKPADESDLKAALAAYSEGLEAGTGDFAAKEFQEKLTAAASLRPFARVAFEYGLRDGWITHISQNGAGHLVSRVISERNAWFRLFGQEFIHDAMNLAVHRGAEPALRMLRETAAPVVEREILVRLQSVFSEPGGREMPAVLSVLQKHLDARARDLFAAAAEWPVSGGTGPAWKNIPGWIRLSLARALTGSTYSPEIPPMTDRNDEWSIIEGRIDTVPPEKAKELMDVMLAQGDWQLKYYVPGRIFKRWAAADYAAASAWLTQQKGRNTAIQQLYEQLLGCAARSNNQAEVDRLTAFFRDEFREDAASLAPKDAAPGMAAKFLNQSSQDELRRALGNRENYSPEKLQALLADGALNAESSRSVQLALAVRERDLGAMSPPEISEFLTDKLGADGLHFAWFSVVEANPVSALRIMVESDDSRLASGYFPEIAATQLYRLKGADALDAVIDAAEARPELAVNLLGRFTAEWAKTDAAAVVSWFESQDLTNPLMQNTLNFNLKRMANIDPEKAADLSRFSQDAEVRKLVESVLQNAQKTSAPSGD